MIRRLATAAALMLAAHVFGSQAALAIWHASQAEVEYWEMVR